MVEQTVDTTATVDATTTATGTPAATEPRGPQPDPRVVEALRVRFGPIIASAHAHDPALQAHIDRWAGFTAGRAPPGPDALDVDGLPVAPARADRAIMARIGAPVARWPGGARAAVIITHDVDAFDGLSYFPVRMTGWLTTTARSLAAGDRRAAARTARRAARWSAWWARRYDPVADFERWMALESRYGVRSTFFFLSLARALSREGRMYRVADPRVARVMRTLVHHGWRVGLHASRYGSDGPGLLEQRQRLEDAVGRPVRAVRHHYLSAPFPAGWRDMRRAGLDISSNVGFHPPHQGFRTGTAWPHRPLGADGPWEVPMALMDAAYGPAAARLEAVFERLLDEAIAVGGALVLNFHSNYVAEVDAPGVHRAYGRILERIRLAVEAGDVANMPLEDAVDHVAARAVDHGGEPCPRS